MNAVFTIGHSTRTSIEFAALLKEWSVDLLIDVRRFPMSRRYPHFNRDALACDLPSAGIAYVHEEVLGGRRQPRPDSRNTAWRNPQFRGYADHMETPAYRRAIDDIVTRAETTVQAVMCAEAVPWRCHRNLLADALVARTVEVRHIIQVGKAKRHELHKEAQIINGNHVLYASQVDQIDLL